MRVLNRYLLQDFLVLFGITLLVLTFVISLGAIVVGIEYASRGIALGLVGQMLLLNLPFTMTFSVPMSTLTAVLLLFGRLSFDGELTAMRASGLTMWNIISPILLASLLLSALCGYMNFRLGPSCLSEVHRLKSSFEIENPADFIKPGVYVRDFPGYVIRAESREGDQLRDVRIHELGDEWFGKLFVAESATIVMGDATNRSLSLDLQNVLVYDPRTTKDGDREPGKASASMKTYTRRLSFGGQESVGSKKNSEMPIGDLIKAIKRVHLRYPELDEQGLREKRMETAVELNKRVALSVSCFAFTLIGIPLGIRSKRRESSVGIGMSLGLVLLFYLFLIAAETLTKHPTWRPDLVVWIPVAITEVLGFWLIRRAR